MTKAQVPAYLVNSDFFASLSTDDSEEFSIPERNFKQSPAISNLTELSNLLHTLRFWGVGELPFDLVRFIHTKRSTTEHAEVCAIFKEFDSDLKLHDLYDRIQGARTRKGRVLAARYTGRAEVLRYTLSESTEVTTEIVQIVAESGLVEVLKEVVEDFRKTSQTPFKVYQQGGWPRGAVCTV